MTKAKSKRMAQPRLSSLTFFVWVLATNQRRTRNLKRDTLTSAQIAARRIQSRSHGTGTHFTNISQQQAHLEQYR